MNVLGGISGYRNLYSFWRFRVKPHVIRLSVNQANKAINGSGYESVLDTLYNCIRRSSYSSRPISSMSGEVH